MPILPRLCLVALLVSVPFVASGCALLNEPIPDRLPVYSTRAVEGDLAAGAAAIDITPDHDIYLAGFRPMRKSTGVHDPLYARALVLQRGDTELVLVAVDLIGLMRPEVQAIQAEITGIDPRHTIIASTHNHHGPDTMGLWGLVPIRSGTDPAYLAQVKAGVLLAIERARASLRPAELGSSVIAVEDPAGFYKNSSRPGLVDPEVVVLHVREPDGGATIATLIELGCHPEAVKRKNNEITADFPGHAVAVLERELGGVGVYVSGALGALVSPDRQAAPEDTQGFEASRRIGERLGHYACQAVSAIESYDPAPELAVWHSRVYLKNENFHYDIVRWTGIVDREIYGKGYFETEVNLWRIGTLALSSVPGEISPDLGLRIKAATDSEHAMIVGLANDELGYLIPPWDHDLAYYDYERTLCVGRDAGWCVTQRLEDLALLARFSGRWKRPSRVESPSAPDVQALQGEPRRTGDDPLQGEDRAVVSQRDIDPVRFP